MRFWESSPITVSVLIGLNALLVLLTTAVLTLLVFPGFISAGLAAFPGDWAMKSQLEQQTTQLKQSWSRGLLEFEAEGRQLAALASAIYSHPDSYPLSAQPGEYDFDKDTGAYVSTRSEDPMAVFLSSASPLNSEVLRDIRLSEYLAPACKSLLENHPQLRRVSLLTVDSLLVSYPWIDFLASIKGGQIKKDFSAQDYKWMVETGSQTSTTRKAFWIWSVPNVPMDPVGVLWLFPFWVSGQFKGILLLEVNLPLAAQDFFQGPNQENLAVMLLNRDRCLIAANPQGRGILGLSGSGFSAPLCPNLLPPSPLSTLLPMMVKTPETMVAVAGGKAWVTEAKPLDGTFVLFVPASLRLSMFVSQSSALHSKLRWYATAFLSLFLLLICGNLVWILAARKKWKNSPLHVAESLAALNGLEKEMQKGPAGDLGEAYQHFDLSLQKVRVALGSLQSDLSAEGYDLRGLPDAQRDLTLLNEQVKLFACFNFLEGMEAGFAHLSQLLCEFFSATNACFLLFSQGEQSFQSIGSRIESSSEPSAPITLRMTEGSFLEAIYNTRQPGFAELAALSGTDLETMQRVASQNVLVGPLFARKSIMGILVLTDRREPWSSEEARHLAALEETVSRLAGHLIQSDRLRRIDSLRREYCVELAQAIETPLNRIRDQVQAIHNRLGRLTPYYKEHCEAILFETGILYQIAQEVRDLEDKDRIKGS